MIHNIYDQSYHQSHAPLPEGCSGRLDRDRSRMGCPDRQTAVVLGLSPQSVACVLGLTRAQLTPRTSLVIVLLLLLALVAVLFPGTGLFAGVGVGGGHDEFLDFEGVGVFGGGGGDTEVVPFWELDLYSLLDFTGER